MPLRKGFFIVKAREGQRKESWICCCSFRSPTGRHYADPSPPEISSMTQSEFWNVFGKLSLNLSLEWLSVSNLLGLIKSKHEEQMPNGERFPFLFSHLPNIKMCCCNKAKKNKGFFLCNKLELLTVTLVRTWSCKDVHLKQAEDPFSMADTK